VPAAPQQVHIWRIDPSRFGRRSQRFSAGSLSDSLRKSFRGTKNSFWSIIIGPSGIKTKETNPMKKFVRLFLIILPMGVCAQQGMSQVDMQQMMQQAKKMEACMANIDQAALAAMSKKADAMEQEVKNLCQAGKRDEAQKRAMEFGLVMAANEEMKKMRQCGGMMRGMMPKIGMPTVEEMKKRHICDGY
jgi:hypothetical protein